MNNPNPNPNLIAAIAIAVLKHREFSRHSSPTPPSPGDPAPGSDTPDPSWVREGRTRQLQPWPSRWKG